MKSITKDQMEKMCRDAGLIPVAKRRVGRFDILIADGIVANPAWTLRHMGGDDERFSGGCYASFYFVSTGEQTVGIGRPLLFELFHDPSLSREAKQLARINAAVEDAKTDPLVQRYMNMVAN